jgi:hypothetical protein
LTNYLTINQKNPSWQCVVCSKNANYGDLIVDRYIQEIIQKSEETEVEVSADGTWQVPVIREVKKRKVEESVEIVISDDESNPTSPITTPLRTSTEKAVVSTLDQLR